MNKFMLFFHKLGSPPWFYRFSGRLLPWLWAAFLAIAAWGLFLGLLKAPPDYLQGESARIMYIHVPAAYMSMLVYFLMAVMGFIGLVWHVRLAEILMISSAPIGAVFTAVCLFAGSMWGRPTWGTFWVWDARLTSELVLFFLYLGVIGLYAAYDEPRKAARAAALLALVGIINLPIIHFSVQWWNTLHQPPSITASGSSIHPSMLWPMLIMVVAFKFFYLASLLNRARVRLVEQDQRKQWVREALSGG
jgi:heme exporter protein C